jgi:hypothetical protein
MMNETLQCLTGDYFTDLMKGFFRKISLHELYIKKDLNIPYNAQNIPQISSEMRP